MVGSMAPATPLRGTTSDRWRERVGRRNPSGSLPSRWRSMVHRCARSLHLPSSSDPAARRAGCHKPVAHREVGPRRRGLCRVGLGSARRRPLRLPHRPWAVPRPRDADRAGERRRAGRGSPVPRPAGPRRRAMRGPCLRVAARVRQSGRTTARQMGDPWGPASLRTSSPAEGCSRRRGWAQRNRPGEPARGRAGGRRPPGRAARSRFRAPATGRFAARAGRT